MKNFAIFVGGGVVVGILVYILMRRAVMRAALCGYQVGIQDGTKQSNPAQTPPNPAFASGQPLPTM